MDAITASYRLPLLHRLSCVFAVLSVWPHLRPQLATPPTLIALYTLAAIPSTSAPSAASASSSSSLIASSSSVNSCERLGLEHCTPLHAVTALYHLCTAHTDCQHAVVVSTTGVTVLAGLMLHVCGAVRGMATRALAVLVSAKKWNAKIVSESGVSQALVGALQASDGRLV